MSQRINLKKLKKIQTTWKLKNRTYQNLQDAAKAELRGKLIVQNAYIRNNTDLKLIT